MKHDKIINALTNQPQDAKALAEKLGCTVKTARKWLKAAREDGAIPESSITKRGSTMVYVGISTSPKRTKAEIAGIIRSRQAKHQERMNAATTTWDRKLHRKRYQRATKRLEALTS